MILMDIFSIELKKNELKASSTEVIAPISV